MTVTAYDSEGKEILCYCGKPAVMSLIGKDCCISRCKEHSLIKDNNPETKWSPNVRFLE